MIKYFYLQKNLNDTSIIPKKRLKFMIKPKPQKIFNFGSSYTLKNNKIEKELLSSENKIPIAIIINELKINIFFFL